jgi:dTDP-4-dehydrorhamnose reductase
MKILIFGKGYIAGKFLKFFGEEGVSSDVTAEISDVRIEDYSVVRAEILAKKPDVVLNCAGKTGKPNVDWCEEHKMETMFSNAVAPIILARACEELSVYMVHIGSGCVYAGDKDGQGYSECDEPNFAGSFYSRTKALSEVMLSEFPVLQLRLRMPLDGEPGERNFLTKITKYKKVISVPNSLSVIDDFVRAALELIKKRVTGIYNVVNPGFITHKEILDMYKEIVDPSFTYELFSLDELSRVTKAGRSNCGLSTSKLEDEGIFMRPIKVALKDTLEKYKENLKKGGDM